jgi:E3 ubiquitin-protein ligase HUWE1
MLMLYISFFSVTTDANEMPPVPGSSGRESVDVNSGLSPEIPEGVDPSFLAALPDEMREEVIAEQLR